MLKTWTLPKVGAAVLGALLCSVVASPAIALSASVEKSSMRKSASSGPA